MGLLDETLNRIQPLDQDAMEQAGDFSEEFEE